MRLLRVFAFLMLLVPFASFGAQSDFMVAAQLLAAAKNADIQQVQILINNGADVNYVDSTGLSIVCTALMNNDVRAAQILQMYGADASNCDRQIKNYNSKNKPRSSGGLFGGLSSAQSITLAAAGAAVVVGALFLLTDWFDPGNGNKSSSSGGSHGGGGGGGGGSGATVAFTTPYGPAMTDAAAETANYVNNLDFYSPSDTSSSYYKNYTLMNNSTMTQNYLLMMHGYSPLARGYNGLRTLRYADSGHTPVPKSVLNNYAVADYTVEGGRPVNVALVTANGINMHGKPAGEYTAAVDSLDDRLVAWTGLNGSSVIEPEYTNLAGKYYNNNIVFGATEDTRVSNSSTVEDDTRVNIFDLSGNGTAVQNSDATAYDNLLAKVVGGANSGFSNPDYMGFMPYGQMTIFRTGGGTGFKTLASPTNAGTYTSDSNGNLATLTITGVAYGADLTVTLDGTNVSAVYAGENYTGHIGADGLLYLDTGANEEVSYSMALTPGSETSGVLQTPSTNVGTYTLYSDGSINTLTISDETLTVIAENLFDNGFTLDNGDTGYMGADGLLRLNTSSGETVVYAMTLATDSETEGALQTVPVNVGSYTLGTNGLLATLTIPDVAHGAELTVTMNIQEPGDTFSAVSEGDTYDGYIGNDGLLYLNTDSSDGANVAYSMTNGILKTEKTLSNLDYYNYRALKNATTLYLVGDVAGTSGMHSRPDIFANVDVIDPLHATDAPTITTLLSTSSDITNKTAYQNVFSAYVNSTYGDDDTTYQPASDSTYFFNGLGSTWTPLVLFSTGAVETNSTYSGPAADATFENAAPLVYDNLEHLFASVVAVGQTPVTHYSGNISAYTPSGKYVLMQWPDANNDTDESTNKYYRARMCGIAGTGAAGVDPWCFAAVGATDELAVASAAGAFGALKSAFTYMTSQQIFALAALTADGAYLGTIDGSAATRDSLTSYLQGLYILPNEYQAEIDAGLTNYLDAFKQVFGYGVLNLERATTPVKSVYYYNGTDIVSASGNAYWRAASNTAFRMSGAFGARSATLQTSAFDVLTSIDGELSLPRVWTSEFAIGNNSKHGLYMGDVLGELRTRNDDDNHVQIGQIGFSLTRSARAYDDYMGGLDNMKMDLHTGNWDFAAGYQRHFTDGVSRFSGMSNPILGLSSNTIVTDANYNFGNWSFGTRAFSGAITDESLLEYDPTIASNFEPGRLGFVNGVAANVAWHGKHFGFNTAVGNANETKTVLGAYTDGLLSMGAGQTVYVDNELTYRPIDNLKLTARATFARTTTDGAGDFILGVSPLESNAFAFGADIGNFSIFVAQPLAVRRGTLRYAYADYDVVDTDDGNFAINVADTHIAEIDLSAGKRELRFTGEYRHNFGEFTDGALGFIYRVNPNNTDEFGNESIFMLKMTHRVGI